MKFRKWIVRMVRTCEEDTDGEIAKENAGIEAERHKKARTTFK